MMMGMNKEKYDSERLGRNDDRWTRSIMTGVKNWKTWLELEWVLELEVYLIVSHGI